MASGSHSNSSCNTAIIQQLDSRSRDLIAKIVSQLKSQGNFDELRRDCLEELDKMEAFRQLNQRVESYVATFLSKQEWSESMSKNQIRDSLRKHVCASDALKSGAQRLVTQVLEKKSKSFQTRLEGVVQNYIYMENEKEKKSRYQNRSEPERSSRYFENKSECEKTSVIGKSSSTISDINDIISQIPGPKETTPTSKIEGSNNRNDSRESTLLQSTSTHHRTDSSLPKQASGSHSKAEQSKFERKGDTSLSDAYKNTMSSKANVSAKKVITSKRVIPKVTAAQNTGNLSEKTADPNINPKTKAIYNKPSHSPKVESPRDSPDVEKPTKPETVVNSLKSDVHKTSPACQVSKLTAEKSKHSETSSGLHARQKVEDKHVESKLVQENIKPNKLEVESKGEEMTSENQAKGELQERKIKDSTLTDIPQEESKVTETKGNDVDSSGNDYNKDTATEESLSQDSESDIGSDVSDVSSVHTSDLSSFDGEVSSDSNHSDGQDPKYKRLKEGTPRAEGKSERKGKKSSTKGAHMSKGSRMQNEMKKSSGNTADTITKRKRGRPRKYFSTSSDTQNEREVDLKQQKSRPLLVEEESSDGMPVRDRSKRRIKKKRCYSPSSEGSREVCLPSKRSRVSSRD